jgi:cysteinyl-tRNA synthetase
MDSIKKQIQLLLDKGYAYIVGSDVYYDVSKFKDYTKISGMRIEELEKHRIDVNKDKRNPYDFALWKGAKPGEPSWEITLARGGEEMTLVGRPGWHIEDTAMTYAIFGEQYDVHGGAIELLFPHHTNEIAQAEAAFGKVPFVKYWLHSGILSIKGEKMSKSLKNFVTIRESLIKHSGEAIRLFVASTHYRKEISYSERLLDDAERKLNYLYSSLTLFYNVLHSEGSTADAELSKISGILESEFISAMNDDFNTPLAISSLTTAMAGLRKLADSGEPVGKEAKDGIINTVLRLAGVIGILADGSYKKTIPEGAVKLLVEREELRRAGKYAESDGIRERLGREYKLGIEDTEHGTIWWNLRG